MTRQMMTAALIAATATLVSLTPADAQSSGRKANEITVTRRSYFDAGTMVRPGSTGATNYVAVGTTLATPAYSNIATRYGAETLPQRFDLPNCCGVTVDFVAPFGGYGSGR
ncbi:hypothetical protein NK718_09125 [Alsobacter sp. SYSU M60028]|uniref:Uncharacterized protein n=1 Tax=Alsobacter ponti TaxID=2962936 RepID=A0ABT1LB49_9HYPH|nr:hypothetical protein [Alsobacter ponti]MCP8938674.1 hypothetical protein [Alsobacter ponti]